MDKRLSFLEHVEELRKRILHSLFFIALMSFGAYFLADKILPFLVRPVGRLVFISPQEAFLAHIKVSIFCGVMISVPFLLYQVWAFVYHALDKNEVKVIVTLGPLSLFFFIFGVIFGYFVIVPIGIKFLLGFATNYLTPMISVNNYISFVSMLTLVFGVIFELPIIVVFLTRLGIVTPFLLSTKRRYAILFIFIVAALITPPDIVTQCLMAIPLIVLYEIGIIFSRCVYKPDRRGYM